MHVSLKSRWSFRLRTALLAVAACALLLGLVAFAIRVARRYREYDRLSITYECKLIMLRRHPADDVIDLDFVLARGEYYQRMARKYALARRRPWLAVEPDPDPPIRPAGRASRPPVRLEDIPAIAEAIKGIPDVSADGDTRPGGDGADRS